MERGRDMMDRRKSFVSSLEDLRADLLRMGAAVERAIHDAVKSLVNRDQALAERVVQGDDAIDQLELDIESQCLSLLALQQPMAKDLRVIGTALKVITDLERMADHAVDIAQVTIALHGQRLIKPLIDVPRMAELAQAMVRKSLDAYVDENVEAARAVIEADDEVDHLYAQVFRELLLIMMENPRSIEQATHLLLVAQYLERIADHATNLGEWVIYMVTGERPPAQRYSRGPG